MTTLAYFDKEQDKNASVTTNINEHAFIPIKNVRRGGALGHLHPQAKTAMN